MHTHPEVASCLGAIPVLRFCSSQDIWIVIIPVKSVYGIEGVGLILTFEFCSCSCVRFLKDFLYAGMLCVEEYPDRIA
jgi:hypothetical protein